MRGLRRCRNDENVDEATAGDAFCGARMNGTGVNVHAHSGLRGAGIHSGVDEWAYLKYTEYLQYI